MTRFVCWLMGHRWRYGKRGRRCTQNISDERLAEFVAWREWDDPDGLQHDATLMARELTALRASHKRLVDLCQEHIDALDSGYDVLASTAMDYIRIAIAEDTTLEGK